MIDLNLDKYPGIKRNLEILHMCSGLEPFLSSVGKEADDPKIQDLAKDRPAEFYQFLRDKMEGKDYEKENISLKYTRDSVVVYNTEQIADAFDRLRQAVQEARTYMNKAVDIAEDCKGTNPAASCSRPCLNGISGLPIPKSEPRDSTR